MTLSDIFALTGGPDPNSPELLDSEPSAEFLKNFSTAQYTGSNGSGPILNANAILVPNKADNYRDNSTAHDYRLGNGLGVARSHRKQDSMLAVGKGGFNGPPVPNKNFGRSDRAVDPNWNRDERRERADMALKKMGYKPDELPLGGGLKPWQWNDIQALGEGTHGHQYNRNYLLPDADAVHRRLYEPTPSRRTQMLSTDVEVQALRQNRTVMHPLKVVTEDRQREKDQRIPRNTDVIEAVVYENIHPRGMASQVDAPRIWSEASVLRQPVGTNDTGNRAVFDRWTNPGNPTDPLAISTLEDRLMVFKDDIKYVRGQDLDLEMRGFRASEDRLKQQFVQDPNEIDPRAGEFGKMGQGMNGPMRAFPGAGTVI